VGGGGDLDGTGEKGTFLNSPNSCRTKARGPGEIVTYQNGTRGSQREKKGWEGLGAISN